MGSTVTMCVQSSKLGRDTNSTEDWMKIIQKDLDKWEKKWSEANSKRLPEEKCNNERRKVKANPRNQYPMQKLWNKGELPRTPGVLGWKWSHFCTMYWHKDPAWDGAENEGHVVGFCPLITVGSGSWVVLEGRGSSHLTRRWKCPLVRQLQWELITSISEG